MAQDSDTKELRDAFVHEFMWMSDIDTTAMSMEDILDAYDMELGEAKRRYGRNFQADTQYTEALQWLEDRDYTEEEI